MVGRIIFLGAGVLVFGVLVLSLMVGHRLRADLTTSSASKLETLALYVAQDIGEDLKDRRRLLEQLVQDFPLQHLMQRGQAQNWLQEHTQWNPLFSSGLMLLDTHGQLIATTLLDLDGELSLHSYANVDYFKGALAGQFFVGRPVWTDNSKKAVLSMAIPLRDMNGVVVAVLVGGSTLRAQNFLAALHTTRIGQNGGMVLVSPRDKLFIDATKKDIVLRSVPSLGTHAQHDAAMNGFRGIGIDTNIAGEEEIAAVVSVPHSDWFLVARIPTAEAFAPVGNLYRFMWFSIPILLLVLVGVWVLGLRHLLAPLHRAADYADRMSNGDMPLARLPVHRHDEVGHFTEAFNRVLSKLLESQAELQHMAFLDALTALANRRQFDQRLDEEWHRACRDGLPISLILLDIDHFKAYNDLYGHPAGDQCLIQVGRVLQSQTVRAGELAARYGGEEFAVILPAGSHETMAYAMAERIRQKLLELCIPHGGSAMNVVTVSLGIATMVPQYMDQPASLIAQADLALYEAKQKGRNQVRWVGAAAAA